MIERLEDIQEKSRVYGITGTEVLMSALLTGFGSRFQLASSENRTKMIEKIIIKAGGLESTGKGGERSSTTLNIVELLNH